MTDPAKLRCHELYDYFAKNRARLSNYAFMREFLTLHCHFKPAGFHGSHLRCLQVPDEFARYLVTAGNFFVSGRIDRYLEVGVASGGSWFITDSYLRALNPLYQGSVGYDIANNLIDWDLYKARFPDVEFRQQSSELIDLKDEQYGLTLIDARHQDEWVTIDFDRVRRNSRLVSFHDIVLPGRRTTVHKFWNRVKPQFEKTWEFIDTTLPVTCGIGMLQV